MQPSGTTIRLYSGAAPGSEHWTHHEAESFNEKLHLPFVYNVTDPTLTLVAPDPAQANGTAVIVCPGGGFRILSIASEGFDVAAWLAAKGVTSFVLKYRLAKTETDDPSAEARAKSQTTTQAEAAAVVRLAHADASAALAHVREHAGAYGVNPNRIGILGFSAGGVVAASAAMTYTPEARPDFAAPIYLSYDYVIQTGVPVDAPPLFVLAATDDATVPATQSIRIYNDWVAAGKTAELHLYATGGHGFGMRKQNLPSDRWIERFADWLGALGLLAP